MNYNNLAQKTNFLGGSSQFKNIPFFIINVNIPGINFSHPMIGGRHSVQNKLPSDNVQYNNLTLEMLIDEDLIIYKEIFDIINSQINIEEGKFSGFDFDYWIEITNSKNEKVLKLDFYGCRIESISDIILDSQDDSTEYTLTLDISYDYYKIESSRTLTERE